MEATEYWVWIRAMQIKERTFRSRFPGFDFWSQTDYPKSAAMDPKIVEFEAYKLAILVAFGDNPNNKHLILSYIKVFLYYNQRCWV